MLSRSAALAIPISLARAGDLDLREAIWKSVDPTEQGDLRDLLEAITTIFERYSYLESPRFATEVVGKSEAFVEMRARLELRPETRRRRIEELCEILRRLPESGDELRKVLPAGHHNLASRATELAMRFVP